MRSRNPMFNRQDGQVGFGNGSDQATFGEIQRATYKGISSKVLIYLAVTLVSALIGMTLFVDIVANNFGIYIGVMIASVVVGLIAVFTSLRKPKVAAFWGSIYCVCQGLIVGLVSFLVGAEYSGVVSMALMATLITLAVMSLLYFGGVVRVGSKFRRIVITFTISMFAFMLLFFVMSLFIPSIAYSFANNFWLQVGVSAIMIVLASFYILMDLDSIQRAVQGGADKQYEWTLAFGLMVTLIWLYIEFLRLFLIIASRGD